MMKLALLFTLLTFLTLSTGSSIEHNECLKISSCSLCISKTACIWWVTKGKCTRPISNNDNVIYPKHVMALLSGDQFCPKVVEPEEKLSYKSGEKEGIVVKVTQMHLYMAYTPWKCKINVDGKEDLVTAMHFGDNVFCEAILLSSKSESPSIDGEVSVLWDHNKPFDGSVKFEVCRCDLNSDCLACKE